MGMGQNFIFNEGNYILLTQSLSGKSTANIAMMLVCEKADFYSSLFFGSSFRGKSRFKSHYLFVYLAPATGLAGARTFLSLCCPSHI